VVAAEFFECGALSPLWATADEPTLGGFTMATSFRLHVPIAALVCVSSIAALAQSDADWKAGVARVKITPPRPVVLLGYGDRTGPFESVVADIYAKALALEDRRGQRAVMVTADLVGFQAAVVTDEVCRRIEEKTGLQRKLLLFNASHSHTGPLVSLDPHPAANSVAHAPLTAGDVRETVTYTRQLQGQLVQLVCDALSRLEPARLAWGAGQVDFPMNRRLPRDGRIVMSDNPAGPADRSVPVLRVDAPDGTLRCVLFGCACHNATLTGRDNVIAGDYAGFAQQYLEQQHPRAQAMFMSGCGADANPSPRGSLEIARRHGATLGGEVDRVLGTPLKPIQGNLSTAYRGVELPLQVLSRPEVEARSRLPSAESVMARHMLRVLDSGETLPRNYRAPLAVWQFGNALTLVALPAEPVADYAALVGRLLGPDNLWVAGFNNDCFGYLPTAQVVREGGHEAIGITRWIWGRNLSTNVGFFAPEVEQVVLNAVGELAQEVGRAVKDDSSTAFSLPSGLVFPEADWVRISPEQAGFDGEKLGIRLAQAQVTGGSWGGVPVGENDWGAVLTRGGQQRSRDNCPGFLADHHTECDGYFDGVTVVSRTLLAWSRRGETRNSSNLRRRSASASCARFSGSPSKPD